MYQQILKNRLEKKIIPFLPSKIKNLKDEHKKLSYAFLIFSLITILDITIEEAIPLVTEGQDDKGIDAIFIDDNNDITFFQSKYFQKHSKKIGENEVIKLSSTIDSFLIKMEEINGNKALTIKLKEIKKILKNELSSPKITTVFISNNTECLEKKAEDILKNIQKIESKRHYIGYTLSNLFNLLETNKIDFDFTFTAKGSGYSDDFGGIKSYTINLPAKELIRLYKEGGEANVLSKNIRFFIGKSRINKKIQETAIDPVFSDFFWFFNNGISIITDSIEAPNYWNDIDAKSRKIKLKNPQIINGGQTTRALYDLFEKEPTLFSKITEEKVFILTRIYQIDDSTINSTIIDKITEGTNSQNAIFFRDLKANNKIQKIVASYFKDNNVNLEIKRNEFSNTTDNNQVVKNDTVFQAYISLYKELPHMAKNNKSETFKRYFDFFFDIKNIKTLPLQFYRSYEIWKYVSKKSMEIENENYFIDYANFSIIYSIGKLSKDVLKNKSINNQELEKLYIKSCKLIGNIVSKKENELGKRFNVSSLFKKTEIKDLIDIEIEKL